CAVTGSSVTNSDRVGQTRKMLERGSRYGGSARPERGGGEEEAEEQQRDPDDEGEGEGLHLVEHRVEQSAGAEHEGAGGDEQVGADQAPPPGAPRRAGEDDQ